MIFNLINMIKEIKEIDGISLSEKDFFDLIFGSLALEKEIKINGKPLSFDSPRISDVMTGKENLYESVAKLAQKKDETKADLLKIVGKVKNELFGNVSISVINDTLAKMDISDKNFAYTFKEIRSKEGNNDDEIFAEYLLYAMKLEYEDRQTRKKYKIATGNFVTKKADATICSELIEHIIRNAKFKKENIKHNHAWSLEDKMSINCFNEPLKEQINEAFDDYETVMTAIDNLSELEIQARKTLYSSYQNAYCRVLSNLLGDDYDEGDIRKSSSTIFMSVNDFVYDQTLKGKTRILEDVVRYNLFCITVAVFYQCKFLIKVEGEKK